MRSLLFMPLLFCGALLTENRDNDTIKAFTKFGFFNVTFTWSIDHFQLYNFGHRYDVHPLVSPILKAVDYSNGGKIYTVKFTILPQFYFTNEILNYSLKTEFNINPRKTKCFYKINGNTIFKGAKLVKSQFRDVLDSVEINFNAIFNNHKSQTSLILDLNQPFSNETQSLISNELLQMYENDTNSKFIVSCNGTNITAYKPVMQARSLVFRELLSNSTNEIEITEFEPKIVEKMIEFCNFDKIESFDNDELEIFLIANFYKIQSLLIYASHQIVKTSTIQNAILHYEFANFNENQMLEKWFFNFIINNIKEISFTPDFDTLDDKMYKKILIALLAKNKIN